jgi:hypothetical protein
LRHSFYLFLFLNSLKRAHSAGFPFSVGCRRVVVSFTAKNILPKSCGTSHLPNQ